MATLSEIRKSWFGDRAFYKSMFVVAIPLIVQQMITSFVNMLDNIMVGQVGTVPMSGVSIVNGLLFIFYLCIFGASSGAGIFTAQFFGSGDHRGIRHTFRFKLIVCTLISLLGCGLFYHFSPQLIGLYLTCEGEAEAAAGAMDYGIRYLNWMLWGMVPFAVANAYSSTLRETGQTIVPMAAGIAAVLVNLVLNYVLIFGHFGAPAMGVEGAALATVISRYAELAIVALWSHLYSGRNPFIVGAYRSPYIPLRLLRSITVKGMPLLVNELLWASGVAIMNQCYSTCGLDVVPALNITSTLSNLASVVFMAMGNSVGIIMGQMLGSGCDAEQVRDSNRKLVAVSVASGADGHRRRCLPPDLQHHAGGAAAGRLYDHHCSDRHALPFLLQCNLLYPPLRRRGLYHLPLRQRIHVGGEGAGGLLPEPVYESSHPTAVHPVPDCRCCQIHPGLLHASPGQMDSEPDRVTNICQAPSSGLEEGAFYYLIVCPLFSTMAL